MGKVEKTIVLGVLFVIAVILVVSLTVDDPLDKQKVVIPGAPPPRAPAAQDQPASAPLVAQSTPPVAAPGTAAAQPNGAAPGALLSAQLTNPAPAASPAAPAPVVIPAGSLLKTSAGLEEGFSPEFKFYTWQAGDNFRSLATRFYGDATKVALLRRFNEGRFDVTPGERVYIPVFDADGARTPVAGSDPKALVSAAGDAATPAAPNAVGQSPALASAAGSGARQHVVQEGESLWKISKQELGAGSRWKEIFEANRDVMSSPEALHTGLKLRIP
jgi:nucleoid-associated protein YgaU